jgi:hypothetical protein
MLPKSSGCHNPEDLDLNHHRRESLKNLKQVRFISSTLYGGEWSASRPSRFTQGRGPQYPLDRRLVWPQGWSGRSGEEKEFVPGIETRSSCISLVSVLTELRQGNKYDDDDDKKLMVNYMIGGTVFLASRLHDRMHWKRYAKSQCCTSRRVLFSIYLDSNYALRIIIRLTQSPVIPGGGGSPALNKKLSRHQSKSGRDGEKGILCHWRKSNPDLSDCSNSICCLQVFSLHNWRHSSINIYYPKMYDFYCCNLNCHAAKVLVSFNTRYYDVVFVCDLDLLVSSVCVVYILYSFFFENLSTSF